MIKINQNKNCITISGHAGFADYGKDIVCASVSSIIYTTVNGILNLNSNAISFNDNGKLITIDILLDDDITLKLIDNMMSLLEELEKDYPENLKISKGEWKWFL